VPGEGRGTKKEKINLTLTQMERLKLAHTPEGAQTKRLAKNCKRMLNRNARSDAEKKMNAARHSAPKMEAGVETATR